MATGFSATFAADAAKGPDTGDLPPPLVATGIEGQAISLAGYAGKAIVISFWATWCPYCIKELPVLHAIQASSGHENIEVIAVNTESRDVFRKAARALYGYDVLMARDDGKATQAAFGVHGIPHMVIIGRDGRIVAVYRGYDEQSLPDIVADINRAVTTPAK